MFGIGRRHLIAGAIFFASLFLLMTVFVQVGAGERGVLMNFGAVQSGVLNPGIHIKIPIMQSVVKLNVQVQNAQAAETSASLDLQDVTSTVSTNWHILPSDAEWVYQNIGTEESLMSKIIRPAISDAVKAVSAHHRAEDLVAHRDLVRDQIEAQIRKALKQYRVVVDSTSIVDFQFSPKFSQAIEQKQVAQQHAQQAQYDLQKAQVVAQQRIVEAQAQSKSQQLLQSTITPEIIQQEAVAKWNGVLPQVVGGSGVIPMIGAAVTAAPHP